MKCFLTIFLLWWHLIHCRFHREGTDNHSNKASSKTKTNLPDLFPFLSCLSSSNLRMSVFFFFWSWSWIKVYLWCKQASTKLSLLLTLLHLIRVRHHLQNKLFLTARVVFTSSSTAEHQSCWYLCTRQMYAPGGLPHVFFVPSPLLFLWPQPSALTYVLTVHSATLHW